MQEQLDVITFLQQTYSQGLWEKGLNLNKLEAIQSKLTLYKRLAVSPNYANKLPRFYQGSPAAMAFNVRLPIVQGPMSSITVSSEFASAVYEAGAFPFLALAGLSNNEVEQIISSTAAKSIAYGVGIVAVSLTDADFEIQIKTFEKYRPELVLVGTPQLNHIHRLLRTGLNIAAHAPNLALFKALYDMGVRCFVIEGEDAGGHVSNLGGLTAWQDIFSYINKQTIQDDVHIILAGGIKQQAAKDLITLLLNYYNLPSSFKISLQLGTAYLASKEILEKTSLASGFQRLLLQESNTYVTGESLSRRVRQLVTKNSQKIVAQEWSIYCGDDSYDKKKTKFENLYQGGLKRAIASTKTLDNASYMAGSVSAVIKKQETLDKIHGELLDSAPSVRKNKAPEPIAIVGIGLNLPGAKTIEEHFYNIAHQRCFIDEIPENHFNRDIYLSADKNDELTSYSSIGAFVSDDDIDLSRYKIPPVVLKQILKPQRLSLYTAEQALRDASYFEKPFSGERAGVILGANEGKNQEVNKKINWPEIRERLNNSASKKQVNLENIFCDYEENYIQHEITEDTLPGILTNIGASRVANYYNFRGVSYCVEAACASSLIVMSEAVCKLRSKELDVVLAGGIEADMSLTKYIMFSRVNALSSEGCFPFDKKANGFVLGEGGVIYVLKRYSDALQFGDKIYALIQGEGTSSDGSGKGITAPDRLGQSLAMQRALKDAHLTSEHIDLIESHGTGTEVGDKTEFESNLSIYGRDESHSKKIVLSASKAMVGHTRCAAGAVGLLNTIYAINSRYLPTVINYQSNPVIDASCFKVVNITKKTEDNIPLSCGISGFGFGGINAHLIVSSPKENIASPILTEAQFNTCYYQIKGDLAWVCPGQGSQYVGMLADYKDDPDFIALITAATPIFREYSNIDLLSILTTVDNSTEMVSLLQSTEISQPALFITSLFFGSKLAKYKIKADMIFGHSLGEYSALYLAGILNFVDAFKMVCIRGQLMSAVGKDDPGAMIALNCNERVAEEIIKQVEFYASCANYNAYNQTVIACSSNSIEDIFNVAMERGVRATQLKVARGFHSKFVDDSVEAMGEALATCNFTYPKILVSANKQYQSYSYRADRIGEKMNALDRNKTITLLKEQINSPVHFLSQVESAYQSGIRRFIEVGPKDILTKLIKRIERGKYVQVLPLDKSDDESVKIARIKELLCEEVKIPRQIFAKNHEVKKNLNVVKQKKHIKAKKQPLTVLVQIKEVVANVSGYDKETLDNSAEFERDLGIDTLKIFDIIAQLRGTVLPEKLSNFRELNSINKLLNVAGSISNKTQVSNSNKKEIYVYKNKTHILNNPRNLQIKLDDYNIIADVNYPSGRAESPHKLLILQVANTEIELRNSIHKLLYDKAIEFSKQQIKTVLVASYGAGKLAQASINSVSAYVNSMLQDNNGIEWHYNHFEQLPSAQTISRLFCAGVGIKHYNDKLMINKLQKINSLMDDKSNLTTNITSDDHILITGGARGIAAYIVQKLYHNCSAKFTLLGRKREIEPWILELDKNRIKYVSLDITNKDEVEKNKNNLSDATLLFHAAGIEHHQHFLKCSCDEFMHVIDVKVRGLFNVLNIVNKKNIRALVSFSSVVGYWGSYGRADYAMANATLNSQLGDFPCLSIAWTAWADIGMAARGVSYEVLQTQGRKFISPDEGSEIFQNVLCAFLSNEMCNNTQLVVTEEIIAKDKFYCNSEENINQLCDLDGLFNYHFNYNIKTHPELLDHVLHSKGKDKIILPGSMILAKLLHDVNQFINLDNNICEFNEVDFISPLVVFENNETILLRLDRSRDRYLFYQDQAKKEKAVFQLNIKIKIKEQLNYADNSVIKNRYYKNLFKLRPNNCKYMYRDGLSFIGSSFFFLENISLNNNILCSEFYLQKNENKLFNQCNYAGKILECCFQLASRAAMLFNDNVRMYIPAGAEAVSINLDFLKKTNKVNLYLEIVNCTPKVNVANIVGFNENNKKVIEIRKCKSSTIIPVGKPSGHIFKNNRFSDNDAQYLFADIQEIINTFSREEILTNNEQAEIVKLNSNKRKTEKIAGKYACKLLENWDALINDQDCDLKNTEVLSAGPVKVKKQSQGVVEYPFHSISHSHDIVYVARSKYPIGVDIEKIRMISSKTSDDIYGKQKEMVESYLRKCQYNNTVKQLFPLIVFTQKEAVVKAHGIGLGEGYNLVKFEVIALQEAKLSILGKTYLVSTYITNDFVYSKGILCVAENNLLDSDSKKYNLTEIQRNIISLELKQSASWSATQVMVFSDKVDKDNLVKAINYIVKTHDVLRSRFVTQANIVAIKPYRQFTIHQLEINLSIQEIKEDFINRYNVHKYDLLNDDLYNIELYKNDKNETILLVNFHHLIIDCYNIFIFGKQLLSNYNSLMAGNKITQNIKQQYYELELNSKPKTKGNFWESYLDAVEKFTFPQLSMSNDKSGNRQYVYLANIDKSKLDVFSKNKKVTLFTTLFGIIKICFAELYGNRDLSFFIPFSEKNTDNYSILGSFARAVPVRAPVINNHNKFFSNLLDNIILAIENRNEQFDEDIWYRGHNICIQLIDEDGMGDANITGVTQRVVDGASSRYPLNVNFFNIPEEFYLELSFNTNIVSRLQAEGLAHTFEKVMNRLLSGTIMPLNKVEVEKQLCDIWQEVLGIDKVDIYDNFFELGGDLLLAKRLVSKCKMIFDIDLPRKVIFDNKIFKEMVKKIEILLRLKHSNVVLDDKSEIDEESISIA